MIAAPIDLEARAQATLNGWLAVGLAKGTIRGRRLESFHGEGLADIASRERIFTRIGGAS